MDAHESRRFNRRARVVLFVFVGGLALVGARAAQLQIKQHGYLARLARDQYLNTVKIPARRGHIYDRNGNPLAISVDVPSVYANPSAVSDAKGTARKLAKILHLDVGPLTERLASERYFTWLKRQVTPPVADQVKALNLAGVNISKEPRRFYPNRDVAAHVIGFAGMDARGLEGVEKQLDAELLGEPQTVPAVRDGRGVAVLAGGLDPEQRSRGSDVHLTIDLQIQHAAQEALERVVKSTHAKSATAVVLDVLTAEVLTMAVAPGFNPNGAADEKAERRRNRVLTDMFEPGSTLKPLVMAAALDAGVVGSGTQIFCENGRFALGRHTISDTSKHGLMSLTEILAKSSNIGMAKISQMFGRDRLEATLRAFGMGKRTGVEFPGEAPGVLRAANNWSELETATIAFGQGMASNSLQIAAAYRVLAADGIYKEPHLVKSIERPDGSASRPENSGERVVIRASSAKQVTAMLEAAVQPSEGTGRLAAVPGYRVAGKTGTAQKADSLTGGYSADRFMALFAGYLPAEAPRAVIVVAVDEPVNAHLGGIIAAPVFAEIGQAVMQRLGVVATMPVAQNDAPAKSLPAAIGLLAANSDTAVPTTPVVDAPEPLPGTMPSFLGMTSRQAVQRFVNLGLSQDLELQGTGCVIRQDPAAGSAKMGAHHVRLVLGP